MVAIEKLQPVAEVLKLFGNNGTVIVKFRPNALVNVRETEPVFAIMEGIPVPFFMTTFQRRGADRADILFDAIYRESQARELVGKTLYQTAPERKGKKDKQPRFEDPNLLAGFTVSDSNVGPLGHVEAFFDWSMNPCLSIRRLNSSETFLIPFHEALISDIDITSQHISLSLPKGLLEINK